MKSALLVIVVALAVANAVSLHNAQAEFVRFQRKYNKVYDASEFQQRFQIFTKNLEIAAEQQKNNPNARFGVTKFSDLAPEEFRKYYLMPENITAQFAAAPKVNTIGNLPRWTSKNYPRGPDPNNWDWCANGGACTPIYNQQQCGDCWAFSATETIESYYFLGGNSLTQLSMEQITDCDTSDNGCNGGLPTNAFSYVQNNGGLESYSAYPFTAGGGQAGQCQCSNGGCSYVATVTGVNTDISGESGLYQTLSSSGPISVCVDASEWQNYQGGVLSSCTNNIDHAVQLTGYGNANGGDMGGYWIVRNSWGADWGESGFIWLQQGQNLCSIANMPAVVTAGPAN